MDASEYGMLIKREVESVGDERETLNYEENCDPLEVVLSKNEYDFESEQIKREDGNDVNYNLKFKQCKEEVTQCEVCGVFLSPTVFQSSSEGFKSCCNCLYQNGSNKMHGKDEDITFDLKPLSIGSDPEFNHFAIQEGTIVGKEEEATFENMSLKLYGNELTIEDNHIVKHEMSCTMEKSNELFSYEPCSKSNGDIRIPKQNKIHSKNFNERSEKSFLMKREQTHIEKSICDMCSKSFICSSDLMIHLKTHICKNLFSCKICSKSFNRQGHLNSHEKIHSNEKPFQCKICSKSFIQKSNLKSHEKIHTGEKPFQCEVCSKSFISKNHLKIHKNIHTGEKPFQCRICLKSFTQMSNLDSHEKIHTEKKPFQCENCPKSFVRSDYLCNHKKTHTEKKPFQCKICSKSFVLKTRLKSHERIHSGEKPFQCKICSKSFAQNSNLKSHEKIHTEI